MQTSVILFFSGVFVLLSMVVGIIAGWHINDVVYSLVQKKKKVLHTPRCMMKMESGSTKNYYL